MQQRRAHNGTQNKTLIFPHPHHVDLSVPSPVRAPTAHHRPHCALILSRSDGTAVCRAPASNHLEHCDCGTLDVVGYLMLGSVGRGWAKTMMGGGME